MAPESAWRRHSRRLCPAPGPDGESSGVPMLLGCGWLRAAVLAARPRIKLALQSLAVPHSRAVSNRLPSQLTASFCSLAFYNDGAASAVTLTLAVLPLLAPLFTFQARIPSPTSAALPRSSPTCPTPPAQFRVLRAHMHITLRSRDVDTPPAPDATADKACRQ